VPEVPFIPLVPSAPEVPDEPERPLVPDVPLLPDNPEVPDVPLVPEVPDPPFNTYEAVREYEADKLDDAHDDEVKFPVPPPFKAYDAVKAQLLVIGYVEPEVINADVPEVPLAPEVPEVPLIPDVPLPLPPPFNAYDAVTVYDDDATTAANTSVDGSSFSLPLTNTTGSRRLILY
jgi:hypothetical protein